MSINTFFNVEIIGDKHSTLMSLSDHCLSPVRYLFQGRTFQILDGKVTNNSPSYPKWNWKSTACAVILLIPGILLGIPLKLLAYWNNSALENTQIVQKHEQDLNEGLKKKEKQLSELFDLNLIYNSELNGFNYSLPRPILESFFSGKAFDHKKEYTKEEQRDLKSDVGAIYQGIVDQNPEKQLLAIMTAGAPGSGKTTLMKQDLQAQQEKGTNIAYICPDDVCLQQMNSTYQTDLKEKINDLSLSEDELKAIRLECYNKWRPASNAANHLILANLIRQQYAFYFGTTSTGPATGKLLEFLKAKGYTIKLLHITTPDDVRWASLVERDKSFVQTTEQDTIEKGNLFPQRIMDAYLKFADEIDFYYRKDVNVDAVLAATWKRNPEHSEKLGKLLLMKVSAYGQIKKIHNEVCDQLNRDDLSWDFTVEDNSEVDFYEPKPNA